jgi:hypothetical protein
VNQHQYRSIAIFAILPMAMAQNFGMLIDPKAALFHTGQNEVPAQEGSDNRHPVPVLEQPMGPKLFVLCRTHLSNLGEPGRQNKFAAMQHLPLLLTFLGQKASIP